MLTCVSAYRAEASIGGSLRKLDFKPGDVLDDPGVEAFVKCDSPGSFVASSSTTEPGVVVKPIRNVVTKPVRQAL